MPKAYLRELAEAGQLAVFHVLEEGETRLRLSGASLVNAGLTTPDEPGREPGTENEVRALVDLLREQGERLASLEEQRFHLGVQLSSALERIVQLERQLEASSQHFMATSITAFAVEHRQSEPQTEPGQSSQLATRFRDVAWKLTDAGFQRSARIGSSLIRSRPRVTSRTESGAAADGSPG